MDLNFPAEEETPFTYSEGSGKGPENWGRINPNWKACGNGKFQSPIDLTDNRVQLFPLLGQLQCNYKSAPAVLNNKGHDIQVSNHQFFKKISWSNKKKS